MSGRIAAAILCALLLAHPPVAGGEETSSPAEINPSFMKREAAEESREAPETGAPLYKVGVLGFLRGEETGSFSYSLDGRVYTGTNRGRLTYRILPYAEWNPTDYLECEVQGQGYGFTLGTPHDSQFALYQGYLELSSPGKTVGLRLGRQEFVYGSAFILGANSFYNGLTFDAARLRLIPLPGITVDLLAGYYAAPTTHYFDTTLTGAYLSYAPREGSTAELYYLRDNGAQFSLADGHLDTFGFRGTARLGPLAVEAEPVYQTGQLFDGSALQAVDAWGGHLDLSLEGEIAGMKQSLVLGYAYGSGSQEAAAGGSTRKEFSNVNNNTSLVGDMGFFGDLSGLTLRAASGGDVHASGMRVVTLAWGLSPLKELNFTAAARTFRANNAPPGMSRNLGVETDFILTWNIDDNTALIAAYDRLFAGAFFRDATGRDNDINYGYLMLQFNLFAEAKKPTRR